MIDIVKLRKEFGLSQSQVAEKLGCSGSVISRYETGVHPIPYDALVKLANIYGVSPSYIMESGVKGASDLTIKEIELIDVYRKSDTRAREDAYMLLSRHSEEKKD